MKKYRNTQYMTERYKFDNELCRRGWAQVDTQQDASYYGTWASAEKLMIFNFIEGDTVLTVCESKEEFKKEMERLIDWTNKAGYGPVKIDCGYKRDSSNEKAFKLLGLEDYLHWGQGGGIMTTKELVKRLKTEGYNLEKASATVNGKPAWTCEGRQGLLIKSGLEALYYGWSTN